MKTASTRCVGLFLLVLVSRNVRLRHFGWGRQRVEKNETSFSVVSESSEIKRGTGDKASPLVLINSGDPDFL